MKTAKNGDIVSVHYKGYFEDGEVFDTSYEREPLEFEVGSGMVIPGFDAGVNGMKVGDKKTVQIPCDEAYGPRNEELIMVLNREKMGINFEPEVGQMLQMARPDSSPFILEVIEVHPETIKVDANHPMAGRDLIFDLELMKIN